VYEYHDSLQPLVFELSWLTRAHEIHPTLLLCPSAGGGGGPRGTHLPNYNLAIVAVVLLRFNLSAPPKTNPRTTPVELEALHTELSVGAPLNIRTAFLSFSFPFR
jgi:hypothetical protein